MHTCVVSAAFALAELIDNSIDATRHNTDPRDIEIHIVSAKLSFSMCVCVCVCECVCMCVPVRLVNIAHSEASVCFYSRASQHLISSDKKMMRLCLFGIILLCFFALIFSLYLNHKPTPCLYPVVHL